FLCFCVRRLLGAPTLERSMAGPGSASSVPLGAGIDQFIVMSILAPDRTPSSSHSSEISRFSHSGDSTWSRQVVSCSWNCCRYIVGTSSTPTTSSCPLIPMVKAADLGDRDDRAFLSGFDGSGDGRVLNFLPQTPEKHEFCGQSLDAMTVSTKMAP